MRVCDVYLAHTTREFDGSYTYVVPEDAAQLEVGCLVSLPFGRGNSSREAWVWRIREIADEATVGFRLKSIDQVLSRSVLRPDQFDLAKEMRRRYFCSMSQALRTMAPRALLSTGPKTQRFAYLPDPGAAEDALEEGSIRSAQQIRVLEFLLEAGEAGLQELMASCRVSRSVLDQLRKKGLIRNYNREVERRLASRPLIEPATHHHLNHEQREVLEAILRAPDPAEFLLFGVTGSGKTEVYLRAAEAVLQAGRDVLILVPEIALTPLICDRIQARFGKAAAILHSGLTPGERFEHWRSIRTSEKHLVAGARSAIFAPLKDIGLIIIDEEQEASYKSEITPRYEARDIARLRAAMHRSKLLLVSATPSLESFARTESGKSQLLRLRRRAGAAKPPQIKIVDMRQEYAHDHNTVISRPLKASLEHTFARHEQAMIFLNRRGHSSCIMCRECGYIQKCDNCDVNLTEHVNPYRSQDRYLVCHYCGAVQDVPKTCPACGSDQIAPFGMGTEQAENILRAMFPEQKFLRMDADTTSRPGGHAKILAQFAAQAADCLVGTQMIAKGHDFSRVTTVGILSADLLVGEFGYDAEERAYQLISQAAGRAGRAELVGQVIIQAFNPANFAVRAAARQDYLQFYQEESRRRQILEYPPFTHFGLVVASSLQEKQARDLAKRMEAELTFLLKKNHLQDQVTVYPAQAAPVARLRKRWRWRLIVKAASLELLTRVLSYLNDLTIPSGAYLSCDIDPGRTM